MDSDDLEFEEFVIAEAVGLAFPGHDFVIDPVQVFVAVLRHLRQIFLMS